MNKDPVPFPPDNDGGGVTFQTPNGSARHTGDRPTGPSGEKSRHAPTVKGQPSEWGGNRTGE